MKKIKYTYVPREKADNGMVQILFSKDVIYRDMIIIDNAAIGIMVEPSITDIVRVATPKTLESTIRKALIETECDTIILNGFDISLDEVREKYIPMAKEHDIYMCINVISDYTTENNITIHLDYAAEALTPKEWIEAKARIAKEVEEKVQEEKDSFEELEELTSEELLVSMLLGDKSKLKALDDIEDDFNIIETYMYSNTEEEINVHKLENNNIIISDGDNEILLSPEVLKFVIESLTAIK